jgi:hypothetical protein
MAATTARRTLNSMWLILFSFKSRKLTQEEKHDLNRLCGLLEMGIPGRAIYNFAAREFSALVKSSAVFDELKEANIEDLLDKIDALKLTVV